MALPFANAAPERIGGRSPSTAGFSVADGGRAVMKFVVNADVLQRTCMELLGGSAVPERAGIKRKLPVAHPQYKWLFVDRISNIEGLKFSQKINALEEEEIGVYVEAESLKYYAEYEQYEVTVEYAPRPYAVLSDVSIPKKGLFTYYNDAGVQQLSWYWSEWLRFTEVIERPSAEYITVINGQKIFKMDANPPGIVLQDTPVPGGQSRKLIQSTMLDVRWHQVPYSFLTSTKSFIDLAMGRVNQFSWYGYPAGSLLLVSVTIDKIYTPPFPEWVDFDGAFVPSQQKLCDITLNMMKKDIAPNQAYTVGNLSHVPYGHNLTYNASDANWYFAINKVSGLPDYPSYPFELLFGNPDQ